MTKAKFLAFEKVKKSGLTNMYDINEVRFIALAKLFVHCSAYDIMAVEKINR